jgi:hypothetical protein
MNGRRSKKDTVMRRYFSAWVVAALLSVSCVTVAGANPLTPAIDATVNPAIDMEGYLRVAREAAQHRATRRVSEEEFMRMSSEPDTIVLDARSREKYEELHVTGAISLAFSDIAVESLARTIPDRNTRILIYCNNNFANAPQPFPSKMPSASLNISTYIALYNYGYRNVYELGPLIELSKSKLPFESAPAKNAGA